MLNPSRRVQARRVASKSASQRALLRPPERHCTCRVDCAISPLDSPLAAFNRLECRRPAAILLQMHYGALSWARVAARGRQRAA